MTMNFVIVDVETTGGSPKNSKITELAMYKYDGEKIIDVDQTTVEEIKNKPLKGYVCVQNHGGKVDFRNLRVKELK